MKKVKLITLLAISLALCLALTACSQAPTAPVETPSNAGSTASPAASEGEGGIGSTASPVASEDEAAIGNTGYVTLQDAIKAAADDDTITLLKDVVLRAPVSIESDVSFTLDLNGKTLDSRSNIAVQHDGTVFRVAQP
jgi:uncharacterized low-complexity protein